MCGKAGLYIRGDEEWDWSLLFEAQVANVSLIDPDDAVVLLEESLLLGFSARLQALHEQAVSPGNDQTAVKS